MTGFHYSVTATLPDEATAERFMAWLVEGHIADVVEGGARSGHAIRLDSESGEIRIESRYLFPSREAYDAYCEGPALALRAEGVEKFGNAGVSFERRAGQIALSVGTP